MVEILPRIPRMSLRARGRAVIDGAGGHKGGRITPHLVGLPPNLAEATRSGDVKEHAVAQDSERDEKETEAAE